MAIFDKPRQGMLEAYTKASDSLDNYFRSDNGEQYLAESANLLCAAFRMIQEDAAFWQQFEAFAANTEKNEAYEAEVRSLLKNIDDMARTEMLVLQNAGMKPKKAEKLLVATLRSTSPLKLTAAAVRELRERLGSAAKPVCNGLPSPKAGKRWMWVQVISYGVLAAGGVTMIVVNGAAATMTFGAAGASILSGATAATSSLREMDKVLAEGY